MRLREVMLALGLVLASATGAKADGTLTAPSIAGYQNSSGAAVPTICDKVATFSGVSTLTRIVVGVSGQQIRVCGYYASVGGTTPQFGLDYGTGTNCGTGTSAITGTIVVPVNTPFGFLTPTAFYALPSFTDLCVNVGGTSPAATGFVSYAIF